MCLSYFAFWAHAAHEETWHELTTLNILQLFACEGFRVLACLSIGLHNHRLLSTLFVDNDMRNDLLITGGRHFATNLLRTVLDHTISFAEFFSA